MGLGWQWPGEISRVQKGYWWLGTSVDPRWAWYDRSPRVWKGYDRCEQAWILDGLAMAMAQWESQSSKRLMRAADEYEPIRSHGTVKFFFYPFITSNRSPTRFGVLPFNKIGGHLLCKSLFYLSRIFISWRWHPISSEITCSFATSWNSSAGLSPSLIVP